ncbi:IS6 family transposase, partial [Bacillus pseudomycoides]
KGIETVQALYKQNRNLNPDFGFSAYDQLRNLFAIT